MEAIDLAWERVVDLLQILVADTCKGLEDELQGARNAISGLSAGKLEEPTVQADLEALRRNGDLDLLEETALDLLVDSLRIRVAPCFWRCIPTAGHPRDRLPAGWGRRWHAAVAALRHVHLTQQAILRALGTPGSSRLVQAYEAAFRAAISSSWPTAVAEDLRLYFRWTWKQYVRDRRRSGGKSLRQKGREEGEEWWWAALGSESPRFGASARVLALLNPLRRPAMLAAWAHSGTEGDKAIGGGNQTFAGDGHMDDAMPRADTDDVDLEDEEVEEDEDGSDEDEDNEGLDCEDEPILQSLQKVSRSLREMGLDTAWSDLVMQFAVEQLASIVEEKCTNEYDAKGLLDRLTSWLYDPMIRWLRAAHGLSATACASLPIAQGDVSEDAVFELHSEDLWWCSARRVVLQFFQTFLEVRLREAFDLVRDFPDSAPALLDLRRCLARTGQSGPLVAALRQQLTRRLLIAGAHTRDIIKVYIKTIKALRLVDPRGLLLDSVSAPIRAYLKRRKDTVRCIITALTEDTDLQHELQQGAEASKAAASKVTRSHTPAASAAAAADTAAPAAGAGGPNQQAIASPAGAAAINAGGAAGPPQQQQPQAAVAAAAAASASAPPPPEPPDFSIGGAAYEASDEEEDPDSWVPDPIDADPQPRQRRPQDVISLLVGIYGSKEMFIKEYKEMLADRLLGNPSYTTDKEMQNLELLKTRFGEAALGHCEVMLQDIKDSKRINGNVQQGQNNPAQQEPKPQQQLELGQMHALVLSQHYWPPALSKADHPRFKLPQPLEDALADYGVAYTKTRAKRNLQWKRAHGLVELTVQLADRSLTVVVTPIHYAVLGCFTEPKDGGSGPASTDGQTSVRLSLQEVSAQLELPEALVRKRIGFWLAKGVLKEVSAGIFDLQESQSTAEGSAAAAASGGHHLDEDAENSPGQTGSRQGAGGSTQACAAERQSCEGFIQGMLTNYSALPLARIHNFLQMFMTDPAYTQTEVQLRDFLTGLCQGGRLEFDGSSYALVKQNRGD